MILVLWSWRLDLVSRTLFKGLVSDLEVFLLGLVSDSDWTEWGFFFFDLDRSRLQHYNAIITEI